MKFLFCLNKIFPFNHFFAQSKNGLMLFFRNKCPNLIYSDQPLLKILKVTQQKIYITVLIKLSRQQIQLLYQNLGTRGSKIICLTGCCAHHQCPCNRQVPFYKVSIFKKFKALRFLPNKLVIFIC